MVAHSESSPHTVTPDPDLVASLLAGLLSLATSQHDPTRVCSEVAAGATELPGIGAAGVLVRSADGLTPVGTSGEAPELLDLLEVGATSGPAVDCLSSGLPMALESIDSPATTGSTALRAVALPLGLQSAYALPLASGSNPVGVLHLFGTDAVPSASLSVGRSLADVATLSLLGADPDLDSDAVTRRLHRAIEARVTIEQAKGVLAARFRITPAMGFDRLARAATVTGQPLGRVASAVVHRRTDTALDEALANPASPPA